MSDFLPRYASGSTIPCVTSTDVTAGQVLAVSGDNTVAPTTGAAIAFGVAAEDDTVGGNLITVFREGVFMLAASGTINAGDAVVPAAAGAVAAIGADTTYTHFMGVAMSAAASGQVLVALRIA